MVYDCFQFFNELDILKLRLHIMDPYVDKFVISEATETFSGLKKPLYYEENKERFKEFEHKIIHVVVDDTPKGGTHERDTFQKCAVGRGLVGCKEDDIIIYSDLDEIPNPIKLQEILQNFDQTKIYHFAQRLFYCYLNMEETSGKLLSYAGEFDGIERKKWIGSKACTYGLLQKEHLQLGELRFPERKSIGIRVEDGGWHFGYMGGEGEKDARKRVAQKVASAAHQEYNNREILTDVYDKIRDGKDLFGRDAQMEMVPIDDTFPEYLYTHQKEYAHLILQPESQVHRMLRHCKRMARRFIEKGLRGLKRILK